MHRCASCGSISFRAISLGAGVQSTTVALMAAHGEIKPMPDCAIFADTGAEPEPVYDHLRWLMSGNVLPFPVHVASAGNIVADLLRASAAGRFGSIPYYLDDNGAGERALSRRQCTKEYKIIPIARKLRELLGYRPRQRIPSGSVEVWIGISTDEAHRMKPARNAWQANRWPLIEKEMSRWDCRQWLHRNGYSKPPKSACTICPYRRNTDWRWLRDNDPVGFAEAVAVDAELRAGAMAVRLKAKPYLHSKLVPLADVDLSTDAERGQPDLFGNECDGMSGV